MENAIFALNAQIFCTLSANMAQNNAKYTQSCKLKGEAMDMIRHTLCNRGLSNSENR